MARAEDVLRPVVAAGTAITVPVSPICRCVLAADIPATLARPCRDRAGAPRLGIWTPLGRAATPSARGRRVPRPSPGGAVPRGVPAAVALTGTQPAARRSAACRRGTRVV